MIRRAGPRGQAIGIALFLLALIVVGILGSTLYSPVEDISNRTKNVTSNSDVETGRERLMTLWEIKEFLALAIGAVGLVILGVYQRRP